MYLKIDKLKFTAMIDKSTFEVLNSEFTKAKAYILYCGDNRNKSRLSKKTVEEALPTLYNIPVVAEYIEKKEDFGGHGGKIIISDEGVEFIQTTRPYGLVPESANPRWEMVEDKEYLVTDIILWSGRYPELEKTISEYSNQSMEINVFDGLWLKEEDIYDITKFEFSALCILGQSVEPCFEDAKIVTYGLDEFKQELDEMFKKYKEFSISSNNNLIDLDLDEDMLKLKDKFERRLHKFQSEEGDGLEDWLYLIHHMHEDPDGGEEIIHHCPMIDHLGNLYQVKHIIDENGEVCHCLVGLIEEQDVYWSDEEAEADGKEVPCANRQLAIN